jgi:hypothetical protein
MALRSTQETIQVMFNLPSCFLPALASTLLNLPRFEARKQQELETPCTHLTSLTNQTPTYVRVRTARGTALRKRTAQPIPHLP